MRISAAKIVNIYELRVTNYEIFATFALQIVL